MRAGNDDATGGEIDAKGPRSAHCAATLDARSISKDDIISSKTKAVAVPIAIDEVDIVERVKAMSRASRIISQYL